MAVLNLCPNCGADLPASASGGLCPRCLLEAGVIGGAESLSSEQQSGTTVDHSRATSVLENLATADG